MPNAHSFRREVEDALGTLVREQAERYPAEECLRIDLHCHDCNSTVPDELLGRILRLPETWLPTGRLLGTLERNGMDVVTVTNHNNARTCWELLERGRDVLVGAEFSCMVPDFEVGVHVLAYGFDPTQE